MTPKLRKAGRRASRASGQDGPVSNKSSMDHFSGGSRGEDQDPRARMAMMASAILAEEGRSGSTLRWWSRKRRRRRLPDGERPPDQVTQLLPSARDPEGAHGVNKFSQLFVGKREQDDRDARGKRASG